MKVHLERIEKEIFKYIPALMGCWAIQLLMGITVRNPLTVVLFACIYFLNKWALGSKYKEKPPVLILLGWGILPTALSLLITRLVYRRITAQFSSWMFKALAVIIMCCGLFILFSLLYMAVCMLLKRDKFEKKVVEEDDVKYKKVTKALENKVFLVTAAICLLGYLPYFLYEFPGIMTADSLVQYQQVVGITGFSNHHPVVHTLLIKLFYRIGVMLTRDKIAGIACYTQFQMVFMCLCNAAAVREIVRIEERVNLRHIVPAVIFFAFVPFNAVFAVTVWKDVPFAGLAVLFGCLIAEMYTRRDTGLKVADYILFFVLSVLLMLFRSNAFFAMIPFLVIFVVLFKKQLVPVLATAILSIAVVVVIKGPVFDAFNVASPDFTESLSVPLQQVARVLVEDGNVSDEELALIDAVIDRTYVKELYAANYADNIKELVRAGHPDVLEANKGQYLGLWFKLFLKNPGLYVKAWYDLTGGYIYPDVAYSVGDVDGIMSNDMGLYASPIIGGKFIKIKEILLKLGDFMPIYGMLFSIGAYFWGLLITLIVAVRKKRNITIHILMLLIVATLLIASPVVDFRYGYAYVLTMPIWAVLALFGKNKESEEKL